MFKTYKIKNVKLLLIGPSHKSDSYCYPPHNPITALQLPDEAIRRSSSETSIHEHHEKAFQQHSRDNIHAQP
jgi:hypothetical protein